MNNIFQSSHNPDVLSTFSNLSNDEVFTPPKVVNEMLDMLPQTLFEDKDTKFLDPASKSGVFLREIAKRLLEGLKDEIPVLQERIDHIFHNQLYGIAITELTSLLSRRTLYCSKYPNSKYSITDFEDAVGNIYFSKTLHKWKNGKCLICGASIKDFSREEGLENHAYEFIHNENIEEVFNVKFDVIIGNPPYQLNDGGGTGSSAKPIYQKFIEQAKKLQPRYLTMIIPSRWFTGGKGLDSFREMMIKSRDIKYLHDFINASQVFPNVNIEAGVCYFLMDSRYQGKTEIYYHVSDGQVEKSHRYLDEGHYDIFIRDKKVLEVVNKVSKLSYESFANIVYSRNAFLLGNASNKITNDKKKIKVFGRFNGKRSYKFIDEKNIQKNLVLASKYKLFISKADGAAGQIGNPIPARIIGKPEIGPPYSICTETFLVIGAFDNYNEMINAKNYMKTKFFRFLVGARKNKNMTKDTYKFVPLLDFNKNWDDRALYELFNLNSNDIEYIEKMIVEYNE